MLVEKHGSHNQKDHAGKRGTSDLPEGWSKRSDEERIGEAMQRARQDWAKTITDEKLREIVSRGVLGTDEYLGPNGTRITVTKETGISQAQLNDQLNAVSDLQRIAPVPNLEIEINDAPFVFNDLPDSAKGFVMLGDDKINLRPSAVTEGVDKSSGTLMPVFGDKPQLYSVVHEYGHVLDRRDASTSSLDKANVISRAQTGVSRYAVQEEPLGAAGREAFAEAWTGWVGSQGRLAAPVRGQTSFVGYFAEKYNWDAGSADRAPSAGFAKREQRMILADTFSENGAISKPAVAIEKSTVIKFAAGLRPVLKHGRHDQSSHGRRGGGGRPETLIDEVVRIQQENVDYIMGRTMIPPSWTGPAPTLYVPKRTLGDRVASARRKIKAWKQARERRQLERMSPAEMDKLIATNRARLDARRAARGLPPAVYKANDPVLRILQQILGDVVEPSLWVALMEDPRPLTEMTGPLGDLVDEMLDAVIPAETVIKFMPGLRPVLKHGSHNQKDHAGKGGSVREVRATDNESAWNAVLTDEARALSNREKTFPDRYNPSGQRDYGLKDGAIETRVVRQEGPPRVRDYETSTSAGLSIGQATEVEGALGMAVSGYGKPLVPVGAERPPKHVYRVMSNEEFETARSRGYIKSDERMNLASGEGTVSSLRSTSSFYAPVDGSDYRVVRIQYDDADGWRTDLADNYIKTDARVPFERVDLFTSPVSQSVTKHLSGKHDQKSHGRGGGARQDTLVDAPRGEGGGTFSEWGDRAREIEYMQRVGLSGAEMEAYLKPDEIEIDADELRDRVASEYSWEIENEVEGRMNRTLLMEDEDEVQATREEYERQAIDDMVANRGDLVAEQMRNEMAEEMFDPNEAAYRYDEVFSVSHAGTTRDGREIILNSTVTEVIGPMGGDNSIDVKGEVYDDDGNFAGWFHRRFYLDETDKLTVSHERLELSDEYQGSGFARTFNRQAENYYIAQGITTVQVHAALDGGGYAWARQGFDWDPRFHTKSVNDVTARIDAYDRFATDMPAGMRRDLQGLRTRLETLPLDSPDYPTPIEVANFGRVDGVDTWPGSTIMRGSNWYGKKPLVPEGTRVSETEAARVANQEAWRQYQDERAPTRGQQTFDADFADADSGQGTLFPPIPGVVE